ncbi:aminoglycoside phosphotransferase family protein [Nocardioides sp.]|uniref:aminoglycoside phosphotransferase family protein n=1 Tax=Nocardioides sp. TaxID=35761 RepID=UPI0027171AFD|nr:aminoglycoside phosphotransferase family protein [Nocardioides sp.]MDO9457015.1 aminoglycoside phosphotransferase family protein [Nocardioides sp.]
MTDLVLWAAHQVGAAVVAERPLVGGLTSSMRVLSHADGTETVLRVIDREPWLTHRAALATREHETQLGLVGSGVPAPRSLALDARAGAHLMTLLPGVADASRTGAESLRALAATLASIHEVRPAAWPRGYQSWAWEAKHVVPSWAQRPGAWSAAFKLLRGEPPSHEPTFLHRDFGPHNVLWTGTSVTGVVDWVETSTGPAWLDVAHAGTNLAVRADLAAADAFSAAYTALTGRPAVGYWEVMDVVGFLPPPGRPAFFTAPAELRRLEERLVAALARA